jgi:large subunit ribosomal protein L29
MNIEKIRNLGPDELRSQSRDAADQLFRLKFQLKMGQTTGLKKMRELRKDVARIKTVQRERELGISTQAVADTTAAAASLAEKKAAPESAPKSAAPKKAAKKTAAKAKAPKKKAAAKKKTTGKKKTARK